MKRFIIATLLGSLLASGCLDEKKGVNEEGTPIECTDPSESELKFSGMSGYNPEGCSRTERMSNVAPFADDENDQLITNRGDFGKVEQPITIGLGSNAATSITLSASGAVTGTNGGCKRKLDWIAGQPLSDRCVVPKSVSALDFAIFPDYPHPDDFEYMRSRMLEAWAVWKQPVTCTTANGSQAPFVMQSALTGTGERTAEADIDLRFSRSKIPVYPVEDNPSNSFAAHTDVDTTVVRAITPVRFGVQYYTFDFAGIGVNHNIIEGIKMEACVDPGDPIASRRLRNAYIWILAHEMGHVFAIPHGDTGIMRRGNAVSCGELFASANTTVNAAPTKVERAIANALRDSSTLLLTTQPTSGTNCADTTSKRETQSDFYFGNFF